MSLHLSETEWEINGIIKKYGKTPVALLSMGP
jgi:cytosine/adenosine deaminase-related metal-dependent hydrolase